VFQQKLRKDVRTLSQGIPIPPFLPFSSSHDLLGVHDLLSVLLMKVNTLASGCLQPSEGML
jgi:hypothetical protein